MAVVIKKKVLMLGASAVGKTSLVQRFVKGIFSEKYLTTIGVKIDRKHLIIEGQEVDLLLWDINGNDEFQNVQASYFRGASGYLLVIDGTRKETLDDAYLLQREAERAIGNVPFVMIFNKSDLDEWEFDETTINEIKSKELTTLKTSAKTGKGVDDAFRALTYKMLEK